MTHPMQISSDADLLGRAIDYISTSQFCLALTEWLNKIVPYSFTVIFGYMGEMRPIDIYDDFPGSRRQVFVTDYQAGPYLLDPFCLSAIQPVSPGLYRLKTLAPDRFYQGEYYRTYYMRTEIAEEIGFFAQMPGNCQVVLSLMRKERVFSQPEFRRLAGLSSIVTALMRRHWINLADEFAASNNPPAELAANELERLTPREREIVTFILKGYSSEATGRALGIVTGTVRIHRRNIYAKLGISSQRELFSRFMNKTSY